LKYYRRLNTEEKNNLKQKAFTEIGLFPRTAAKRDLTAHLCLVLNVSFTMARTLIMMYDQKNSTTIKNKNKLGVNEYLEMTSIRKSRLKHAVFNYYYTNYKKIKMGDIKQMAATRFNVSKHLIKGIAPKRQDLLLSGVRLPCGDAI
jgi:hypothetical protein